MNTELEDIFSKGESFHGYKIEKLLGKGGVGGVYLVRHEILDVLYALKVLYPDVAQQNPNYVKRFLREAKIATRIRHPNLVTVHDCGFDTTKGIYYLVMDYVSGGNLREAIAFSGKLSYKEASNVIMQIACALDAAQQFSVVHRDIKPENIMMQQDGTVKLVDMGIAKAGGIKDSLRTTAESVFGTPAYVSPEQAVSATDVDVRADIYSLGIVFFEMICGRCPYEGRNAPSIMLQVVSDDPIPDIRDFDRDVPAPLATLIRRMCVKERERRISTPSMLISELAKLGYVDPPPSHLKAEYTSQEEVKADHAVDMEYIDTLPQNSNTTLSFDTEDIEIQGFVSELKKKRKRKQLIKYISIVFGVIAVALTILLILL